MTLESECVQLKPEHADYPKPERERRARVQFEKAGLNYYRQRLYYVTKTLISR